MTALQRRIYSLILRALFVILHYIYHHEPGTEQSDGSKIKREITELLLELDKNGKKKQRRPDEGDQD